MRSNPAPRPDAPPVGLYFHIPFCASKCAYCDFYSAPASAARMDAYTDALCRRMTEFPPVRADTVYLGGGTPSLLGGARLSRVLHAARGYFSIADGAEITVECNPDSVSAPLLSALREAGVNRLSIGVQSAQDDELRLLGRRHTFAQAREAVALARRCGFDNLSLDLMYGLPGQTAERFLDSLEQTLALAPAHLSCYGLKLEEGTPLFRSRPALPGDDEQADLYLALCGRLAAAGFEHYEISNFCLPGRRARHNAKYWDLSEYLGLGAAAHSYYQGRRFAFPRDTDAFLRGQPPAEEEAVDGFDARAEYIMLRLRTSDGIPRAAFERRFGDFSAVEEFLRALAPHGLTVCTPEDCRLTERGFLVSNAILSELLSRL